MKASERTLRTKRERRGTQRVWICASCRTQGALIRCTDGKQRCPPCREMFKEQEREIIMREGFK